MRTIIIQITLILSLLAGFTLVPISVSAGCAPPGSSQGQEETGIGEAGGDCTDSGVTSAISAAVNILSYVAGFLAIVMILVSGFKYITSGGDSNKVGSAKNTLIFALVGIAIAAMAQFIAHYVYNQTNNTTSTGTTIYSESRLR